jgi:hypothetical protein
MTNFASRRPTVFALSAVLLALVIISPLNAGLGYLKLVARVLCVPLRAAD